MRQEKGRKSGRKRDVKLKDVKIGLWVLTGTNECVNFASCKQKRGKTLIASRHFIFFHLTLYQTITTHNCNEHTRKRHRHRLGHSDYKRRCGNRETHGDDPRPNGGRTFRNRQRNHCRRADRTLRRVCERRCGSDIHANVPELHKTRILGLRLLGELHPKMPKSLKVQKQPGLFFGNIRKMSFKPIKIKRFQAAKETCGTKLFNIN